jgi:hypothetical protein
MSNDKFPKVGISKRDKKPTEPLATKELTLAEARAADKASALGHLHARERIKPVPKRDYTSVVTPPPDFGIDKDPEPTRITIDFNRHGQIAKVSFSGKAALIATSGRLRSFMGRLVKEGEIERRRITHKRIIANEQKELAQKTKDAKTKKS